MSIESTRKAVSALILLSLAIQPGLCQETSKARLRSQDILRMQYDEHQDDDLIVAKINTAPSCAFDISKDALNAFKWTRWQLGKGLKPVNDAVIDAMVRCQMRGPGQLRKVFITQALAGWANVVKEAGLDVVDTPDKADAVLAKATDQWVATDDDLSCESTAGVASYSSTCNGGGRSVTMHCFLAGCSLSSGLDLERADRIFLADPPTGLALGFRWANNKENTLTMLRDVAR